MFSPKKANYTEHIVTNLIPDVGGPARQSPVHGAVGGESADDDDLESIL
jgi:hypothetical protein